MPLLNQIFHDLYGNKKNNLKAATDRGWYPANRKLVDHPSLLDDISTLPDSSPDHPPTSPTICTSTSSTLSNNITLNLGEGSGAVVMDQLIASRLRMDNFTKARDKRKARRDNIVQNMKDAKSFSSGVMVDNGVHSLDDKRFLEAFNARQKVIVEKK